MSVEDDIKKDLALLNENIMKAARIAAVGETEDERLAAHKLYDELAEQRDKLQAAVKVPTYDKTDKDDIKPDPYARMDYLEEQMTAAANGGNMKNYSTMRAEKKQLVREHGRRAPVVTSNTAADMQKRREEQHASDLANRQAVEDAKNNPPERSFETESDLALKMTAAAEAGDHKEYSRLRRLRKAS